MHDRLQPAQEIHDPRHPPGRDATLGVAAVVFAVAMPLLIEGLTVIPFVLADAVATVLPGAPEDRHEPDPSPR